MLVFDDSGSLKNRYLHGPAVDQIFADEDALGEILWALTDNQGSVRDVADYDAATDTTTVANHIQYDAFGNIVAESNPAVEFLYAYTGRAWDADAQMYYYRARWYDPATGRFASEDPLGLAPDTNPYRYVSNGPTNFVDPSGLRQHSMDPGYGMLPLDPKYYPEVFARMRQMVGGAVIGDAPDFEVNGYWEGVGQVFLGYGDAIVGTGVGLYTMGRHPLNTLEGLGHSVAHPIQTFDAIKTDVISKSGTLRGQGTLAGDILIGLATGGAAKAVQKTGMIARLGSKLPRKMPNCFVAGTQVVIAEYPADLGVAIDVGGPLADPDVQFLCGVGLVGAGLGLSKLRRKRNGRPRSGRMRKRQGEASSMETLDVPENVFDDNLTDQLLAGTITPPPTASREHAMPSKDKRERLTNVPLTVAMLLCLLTGGGWLASSAWNGLRPEPAVASNTGADQPRFVTKDIEDIESGDHVLAFNPATGDVERKHVLKSFRRVSDHLRVLTFRTRDGRAQTIKTTNEHPFWLPKRGEFVKAGDLETGDRVTGPSGELQTLTATLYEPHPEGVAVYNFKVEDWHTYFVEAHGLRGPPVLVHNANCGPMTPDQQALKELVDEATYGGRKPLSVDNTNTVLDWADEFEYPSWRAGTGDVSFPSNWIGRPGHPREPHIHIPGVGTGHIPVDLGVPPR